MENITKIKVSPSILSCDFSRMADEIKKIEQAGADMLHIDVMDGHFVDNITIGPLVIKSIRKHTNLLFDVHLMIENPEKFLNSFIDAGSDIITVHAEAESDLEGIISALDAAKVKKGVSLKPATQLEVLSGIEDKFDMILLMTVNPGFAGQSFMSKVMPKVKKLRSYYKKDIQVDGGINAETAKEATANGANVLVAGTYIFKSENYGRAIDSLRQ